jgi:23S rRNA G2069 N7-methylase RlmK/C1962 C5-methylase RlmI
LPKTGVPSPQHAADTKKINLRALKLLAPEGILVTSSCSYHLSEPAFIELLHEAACDAHRYLQILEFLLGPRIDQGPCITFDISEAWVAKDIREHSALELS